MAPSTYRHPQPERGKKYWRYTIEGLVLGCAGLALFQVEDRHWSLKLLLFAAMLRFLVVQVKLISLMSPNPVKRRPQDDTEPPAE